VGNSIAAAVVAKWEGQLSSGPVPETESSIAADDASTAEA